MKTIKEYVDHLIENGDWEEGDGKALTALIEGKVKADPDFLSKLKINQKKEEEKKEEEDPVENEKKEKKEAKKATPVLNEDEEEEKKAKTPEEWLQNAEMPEELREVFRNSLMAQNQEKEKLITAITANKRNKFSKEYLATRSLEELQGIAALAIPEQTNNQRPNYSGAAAGGQTQNNGQKPLPRVKMDFKPAA